MSARRHNIIWAPIIIFIRVPLLLPLWIVARVGEKAEALGDWLGSKLPGFRND